MKLFLSLEKSAENDELLAIIKKDPHITITDKIEDHTTVLVSGPLTELAHLLTRDYTLADRIEHILLVGGSDSYGDVTPVAERNIYKDPLAAQHVFLSGIKIIMFGLNVTRELDNRALLALLYLYKPQLFDSEECGVFVETKAAKSKGMTVTDLYSDKQFDKHYVEIVKDYDHDAFRQFLEDINAK